MRLLFWPHHLALVLAVTLVACAQEIPKEALQLTAESLQHRQIQTRRYETNDEAKVLSACAALLQDLGFAIDESESKLGVIVGSKDRDATDAGQVVLALFVAALGGGAMPIDTEQKMRASVITRPITTGIAVRVTFQRMVKNSHGQVTKQEAINEPKGYEEFFAKLSKSLFLEAHQL